MAKEEKQAEELKPCPFCGGEGKIEYDYYDSPLYWVQCVNCSSVTNTFLTEAEAITAWNTRTDTERDELREVCKELLGIVLKYEPHTSNCATQADPEDFGHLGCTCKHGKIIKRAHKALTKAKERSNG
jgi:Lar family restriction alleviation protein